MQPDTSRRWLLLPFALGIVIAVAGVIIACLIWVDFDRRLQHAAVDPWPQVILLPICCMIPFVLGASLGAVLAIGSAVAYLILRRIRSS